jgi:hypothetical protein
VKAIPPALSTFIMPPQAAPGGDFNFMNSIPWVSTKPFDKRQGRCYIQANATKGTSFRSVFPTKKPTTCLRLRKPPFCRHARCLCKEQSSA